MTESSDKSTASICLRSVSSNIRTSDGREIPFIRAVLMISNNSDVKMTDLVLHATLGQEGGTVQDVSGALAGSASGTVPSGGTVSWDVYDLLLPAHQGTASKVHMFGYRAVLNWRFDLAAWAEYRAAGDPAPVRTPLSRWVLHWTVPDPATGAVALTIEEGKD